jgi:hypothetical protein
VEASVEASWDHRVEVGRVQEQLAQLEKIVEGHQKKAHACRIEWNALKARANELTTATIPDRRRLWFPFIHSF